MHRFPEFEDTVCIGIRRSNDNDEIVVLFVKMVSGELTSLLKRRIRDDITLALSPRHVPRYIFQVPDVPYTINGKKIEFSAKQVISGFRVVASAAVANPESLKYFERFFHLEKRLWQRTEVLKSCRT